MQCDVDGGTVTTDDMKAFISYWIRKSLWEAVIYKLEFKEQVNINFI